MIFKGSPIRLTEGPHLYKRNGYFYLLTAEGGTEYEHAVTLARSHDLLGPYELHPQNPILTSSGKPELSLQKAGHASLVETQGGEWYMPHLCGRPLSGTKGATLGRETAIQKVEWREMTGFISQVAETIQGRNYHPRWSRTTPLPHTSRASALRFSSLRKPTPILLGIREPNGLRLHGRESLESNFEQAMLARRLTQQTATATTKISFQPQSFQQMAGIAAYYNTFLFQLPPPIMKRTGLCLQIHSCDDGYFLPLGSESFHSTGELFLRATFEDCSSISPKMANPFGMRDLASMPRSSPTTMENIGASPALSSP